jgi:uncharacterized membrane protein YhaH (DUF805 family)
MNVMFLLGWGALLVLAVRRRLLYLEKSSWWTLPIVAVSFGGTTCLAIFNRVPWWILPLVYFPPQISLITGRTEEPPRREVQHPRVRYALMVLALVDLPLAYGMQTDAQFWAYAVVCVPVMAYLTIDRFRDIGFSRWWSVPYTLIVLSPYFQFYLHPTVDRWFVALASIFLQTPAMFLRKGWHVRSNGSENS